MVIGKLGKLAVKHDDRTLELSRYLTTALPTPPAAADWAAKVRKPWQMFDNDRIGDCTCAALAHQIMVWSANAGRLVTPTTGQVLKAYTAVSGYVPGDESTDNGATCLDVLNYARKTGLGSHKITAYVKLTPKNLTQLRTAIELFGTVYLGLQLPLSAQKQVDAGLWDVTKGSRNQTAAGGWGGHAVPAVAYDMTGNGPGITVITWGQTLGMTNAFYQAYADEAYAVISPQWIEKNGQSPSGFDLQQLQDDLAAITAAKAA